MRNGHSNGSTSGATNGSTGDLARIKRVEAALQPLAGMGEQFRPNVGKRQPKYRPNNKDKAEIRRLLLLGKTRAEIAGLVGINPTTLECNYKALLDKYQAHMLGRVAGGAYERALAGDGGMIQFVLKTRAGWKEKLFSDEDAGLIKRVMGVPEEGAV